MLYEQFDLAEAEPLSGGLRWLVPASFSLMMLGNTEAGDAYTFSELESMYKEAGFGNVSAHSLQGLPQTIIVGAKT